MLRAEVANPFLQFPAKRLARVFVTDRALVAASTATYPAAWEEAVGLSAAAGRQPRLQQPSTSKLGWPCAGPSPVTGREPPFTCALAQAVTLVLTT